MNTSLDELIRQLQQQAVLQTGTAIGAGISGGLDSMVLAEALHRSGIPFRVLHFNHNWRADTSRQDQDFVRTWARQRKIPFTTRTWRNPTKTEAAAREARYRFFRFAARQYTLDSVALAHHQDDLVETFLLQLLRGSGPEGLASLLPERKIHGITIVRPFLRHSRKMLTQIALNEKIVWREDSTNSDESYTRNKIRKRLLPYLRRHADRDPVPLLSRTADIIATENEYWELQLPKSFPVKVSVKDISDQHPAYQRRYLRGWLQSRISTAISYQEIESVHRLLTQNSPAKVNLKQNKHCRRRAGFLFIE